MLLTSLVTAVVSVPFIANANPLPNSGLGSFATKHAWTEAPRSWISSSPAPADHLLKLRIGLKQSNMDELIAHLNEISDPSHSRYGQHLSKEEVAALVQPHDESVELVEEWMRAHGIDVATQVEKSSMGDWFNVVIPVSLAEAMLDTKYHVYTHEGTSDSLVRTLSYSLPSALHGHIDVITPTTMFGRPHAMRKTSFVNPPSSISEPTDEIAGDVISLSGDAVPSSCNTAVTPACLMALYGTTGYTPKSTGTNSIGIAGYLQEFANTADLKTFTKKFRTDATNATFAVVEINGGLNTQSSPGVEANLDIQTTTGLTFPTPNTYYSTGGSPPFNPDSNTPSDTNEPYDQWVDFVLGLSSVPGVISTSYGDDEQTVPVDFATRVCNSFAQLGARGVSLLFSSGDDGVGGGDCKTNDGTNKVLFQPNFPASCPFITAVGGTTRVNPEVAVSFSAGGFSRYFAQPSYQTSAVNTFLTALGSTNQGLFNASGRAYPDVSAQGNNFQIVVGGRTESVGGTSASCPTVSSVIALLNDFRIANGKSTLGFLNPLLYANPSALNDITSGSNPGCSTNGFTGYFLAEARLTVSESRVGPVTGLGTPNFPALQKIV